MKLSSNPSTSKRKRKGKKLVDSRPKQNRYTAKVGLF
jgi:hypothetical protein